MYIVEKEKQVFPDGYTSYILSCQPVKTAAAQPTGTESTQLASSARS